MTDIVREVRLHLLDDQTVRSHVGDRIYVDVMPQNEPLPVIILDVLSDVPEPTAGGHSALKAARVQVDAIAETRKQANQIADAVDAAIVLGGFRGTARAATIRSSMRDNRFHSVRTPSSGSEAWEYRTVSDYEIFYQ